jgi:hypothetical protein
MCLSHVGRMPLIDKYRDMGTVVMGKIESGSVRRGDTLMIMPNKVGFRSSDICIDTPYLFQKCLFLGILYASLFCVNICLETLTIHLSKFIADLWSNSSYEVRVEMLLLSATVAGPGLCMCTFLFWLFWNMLSKFLCHWFCGCRLQ